MLAATLDTSCAQNFLSTGEEESDGHLVELVGLGLSGRVDLRVSEETYSEVGRTRDGATREHRLLRLQAFGRLNLSSDQANKRDELAASLHRGLFPEAVRGTRQDEHNERDCRQLAAHRLLRRDLFVTRDRDLLRRASAAEHHGITVTSPGDAVRRVNESASVSAMTSYPVVSVRDADLEQDAAEIRAVLAPLASDYPDFGRWVTETLRKEGTRVRLGEHDGQVAAVAISQPKDARVIKLSAFYVAEFAQRTGLGGHLLWSEIRAWARSGVEKAYVTISSRHSELVEFFTGFGFLVEGVSPRRYQSDTAELALGKHLIRERVTDDTLDEFVSRHADVVFRVPDGANTGSVGWALQPETLHPQLLWTGHGGQLELVATEEGRASRRWRMLDLERIFHPVRFAVTGRKALLVPIEPRWAAAMLEHAEQQRELDQDPAADKLLLRADNAYYAYPKALDAAQSGTPILFYVSAPTSAVVGEARILTASIDAPEILFSSFGDLGVYRLRDIERHVVRRGARTGLALALSFGLYLPFPQLVHKSELHRLAGRRLVPQGLTPIPFEEFEAIRRTGGLEW